MIEKMIRRKLFELLDQRMIGQEACVIAEGNV
jgi:hypothetical protein